MSGFEVRIGRKRLEWVRPQGVAPERKPRAEATELAPLLIGTSPRVILGGFSAWAIRVEEHPELRLWAWKRERLPGWFCPAHRIDAVCPAWLSACGIGDPNGLPQRW